MSEGPLDSAPTRHRLDPDQLRWRCDPLGFEFETTEDIGECPINIIGQPRAMEAIELGLAVQAEGYNIFVSGEVGCGRSTVVRRMLARLERSDSAPEDTVYVHNFQDPDQPSRLTFPAGRGCSFREAMAELFESLSGDLPQLFESEPYAKRRTSMRERVVADQKARLKEFETKVQEKGFSLVQVQVGPAIAPQLLPMVAGNPMEMDKVEALVEQGQYHAKDFKRLKESLSKLRSQMESVGKELRNMDRELQRRLHGLDRELASPLVHESTGEVRVAFEVAGVGDYLDQIVEDILENLGEFHDHVSRHPGEDGSADGTRFRVNVVVDNRQTAGRPIIWETAPTYRNLFGTIDKIRTASGEWSTDHMRIKAGSLLRANGGILVVDAIDVLVEPAVWAELKRTLRTRKVEIRSFDPFYAFSGISLKPEPASIDVKVVMIGTAQIYRLLYAIDEDFKKIFKVKAEFALHTPLNKDELRNYACFVYKKVQDDELLPFHRDAVAAIVEEGVRLAGNHRKLTTRFTEIADTVREAAYWADRAGVDCVREEHVVKTLEKRSHRVNLVEKVLLEQIDDGSVLLDLEGSAVGQVNGLAVLDLGDHAFAQPSRITATTAMGRAGIINIDREADMSGAIHTKGVLILAGFLRSRFAQDKPLTLTASICFEQSYGPIDGDSASSAELYALLSSLSGIPLRQGIAVTGSVSQRGEVQPIGGVNHKIEGFFDLCRMKGFTGHQGVMIPARNLNQLMLRHDVLKGVAEGHFHVWAVSTIEEGLETLTGVGAGTPASDGRYAADSIFGRVDARLSQLAEGVGRFGKADGPQSQT